MLAPFSIRTNTSAAFHSQPGTTWSCMHRGPYPGTIFRYLAWGHRPSSWCRSHQSLAWTQCWSQRWRFSSPCMPLSSCPFGILLRSPSRLYKLSLFLKWVSVKGQLGCVMDFKIRFQLPLYSSSKHGPYSAGTCWAAIIDPTENANKIDTIRHFMAIAFVLTNAETKLRVLDVFESFLSAASIFLKRVRVIGEHLQKSSTANRFWTVSEWEKISRSQSSSRNRWFWGMCVDYGTLLFYKATENRNAVWEKILVQWKLSRSLIISWSLHVPTLKIRKLSKLPGRPLKCA